MPVLSRHTASRDAADALHHAPRARHTTLEPMWNEQLADGRIRPRPNEDVATLLSVSPNYIFALDRRGNLLVIDAVRGQTLSRFDVSGFSPEAQTILKALKKYGMFVADNGIDWAVSVAPDPRIPVLNEELRKVKGSDFEVVTPPAGYKQPE